MKKGAIIIGILIFSVLAISLVAAQALPAPPINWNDVKTFSTNLLKDTGTSSELVARIVLVLVLTVALYRATEKLTKNSAVAIILALLVSILGVRFVDSKTLVGLLLPYGALAIALSVLIPFILMFFLLETSDIQRPYRKLAFGFMFIAFMMFWWLRWDKIGDASYIYLCFAAFAIGAYFMDPTLRKWWVETKEGEKTKGVLEVLASQRRDEWRIAVEAWSKDPTNTVLEKAKNEAEKKLKASEREAEKY